MYCYTNKCYHSLQLILSELLNERCKWLTTFSNAIMVPGYHHPQHVNNIDKMVSDKLIDLKSAWSEKSQQNNQHHQTVVYTYSLY